jgi:drug/metabolite transporter (DMT)-like permease
MCAAVLCLACLDATAKYLVGHMDTLQVSWARFTSSYVFVLFIANPITRPGLISTRRPVLQLFRSLLMLLATLLNFAAFRYLQLDQVLAILFATPFLVAVLAGPMLGEWVGWRRWIAILVGFAGVLVVTQPGSGKMHFAAIFAVGAAICFALFSIVTRLLARSDSNETTLFYSGMVGAIVMSAIVPFVWTTPSSLGIVALMLVTGAFGTLGHYLLILAHRHTPASVLSPFMYTQLIWATTLGFLVFRDVPDHATLAGAGIVIASGLYLVHRERVSGGR